MDSLEFQEGKGLLFSLKSRETVCVWGVVVGGLGGLPKQAEWNRVGEEDSFSVL